jgi:ferredoxin-type protein NapF
MALAVISRSSFLRGQFKVADKPLFPPWSGASTFADLCDGYGLCVDACPEGIIRIGGGGLAIVDFSRGACTFCADCVAHCPTGALLDDGRGPWQAAAQVDRRCISIDGVVCRTCEE